MLRFPIFIVLMLAAPVAAQSPDYAAAVDSAEKAFRADKLAEAERQFQLALRAAANDGERAFCHERLPAIYLRLGRYDLAIENGLAYQQWLRPRDTARWREWSVEIGRWYASLGHTSASETQLTQALAEGDAPLPEARRLTAMLTLARVAELRGDSAQSLRYWKDVDALARRRLNEVPSESRERTELLWHLSDSLRSQQRGDEAIKPLNDLLTLLSKPEDTPGRRDVLRRLAQLCAAKDAALAERSLKDAHALPDSDDRPSRLARAEIAAELTELLQRRPGRVKEAGEWREKATTGYRELLSDKVSGPTAAGTHLAAFWKLQILYQSSDRYVEALGALDEWADSSGGGPLVLPRAIAEKGSINLYLDDFRKAHTLLRDAVADLERRPVVDALQLPRAYNNLAFATQVVSGLNDEEGLARSEKLGQKCLDLYRQHRLADDTVLVETYNLLGTNSAARGQFAQAVERFRTGIAKAEKLGARADSQRSNLLLNLALLHKIQGEKDEALTTCKQALEVYRRTGETDALGFAYFEAALINMHLAAGQIREAHERVPELLRLCAKHDRKDGPLVVTARHCEALYHFDAARYDEAEKAWQDVQRMQEKGGQTIFLPRTLNWLGLVAEARGRSAEAKQIYDQARAMQQKSGHAFPGTHFLTLWRLAQIERKQDDKGRAEARRLLDEAVRIVERARLETFGDAQQRANYFARFAPAFDQMVTWAVEDGDVEAALVAATRGRSRTLLDQLLASNVDPRAGVPGEKGDTLRAREDELRRRLSALRVRAQLIPADAAGPAADFLKEYDQTRQEYAGVWRELFNANQAFRALSVEETSEKAIAAACNRVRERNAALVVYHFGRDRSHVLLIGDKVAQAYPLVVSEELASLAAAPKTALTARPGDDSVTRGLRGFVLDPVAPTAPPAPAQVAPGKTIPLRLTTAQALVQNYRRDAVQPSFRPDRGFVLDPVTPSKPVPVQRREVLGDVLLPAEVRTRLQALKPDHVIIVPDGPLHGFPLEALLLAGGDKPRYVLDEVPPLVYIPSAAILTRPAAQPTPGALSLLTVANPAYLRGETRPATGVRDGQKRNLEQLRVLSGRLPELPGTEKESAAIRQHFKDVSALSRDGATKQAVMSGVAGKRFIHIAAHGFATEEFGNLFGALALSPTPEDDGFLSLHEIYALPLKDCDLAVLSACVTNVGPQRPLEAGVSLANAFLTAGARRVVASHWSVDDEATAVLMETFFKELTAAAAKGERVSYARALQRAQREVRNNKDWAAPHFWAPFVLLGQPD